MLLRSCRAALLLATTLAAPQLFSGPAPGPFGDRLRQGFEALEIHDYFKARKLFLQQARRHPAAAWYGLSVIAGRGNNPFHDEDSCYAYILRSDAAFTMAPDKERVRIGKLGVSHEAIEQQKAHAFRLGWERAKSAHSIAAYDRYINAYTQSPFIGEATSVRDHLAFQQARAANTAAAYREFLNKYPRSREVHEARTRCSEATYRESTADGTLASFKDFIRDHPENPWARQAEAEVFRLSTPNRTAEEYAAFIRENPRNRMVNDAWRAIYELRTRSLSTDAITRFLQEFPDYPFVEELVLDYQTASLFLLPFRRDSLWGYIDEEGNERIKATFEWAEPFVGAQALVGRNGRTGSINRSGRVLVPIEYDELSDAVEGTSTVERNGRVGAVDRNGDLVVPMDFEDVGEFSQGLAYAQRDGLYGYINPRGETAIPFSFLSAGTFRNGLAVVEQDGGFGVIDEKGNVVLPAEHDWVEGFEGPVSRVRKDGRFGLVSPFGDLLVPLQYDHIGPFRDGLALAIEGKRCGYVDQTGRLSIPLEYEATDDAANWGDYNGGLAEVQSGGKRCMIDARNVKVLPCAYADIGAATGALIPVRKKGKWGYADRKGNVLFDNRYDQAFEMNDGYARIRQGELFGLIDSTGKECVAPAYQALQPAGQGLWIATGPGGAGLIDVQGRLLIAPAFDAVKLMSAGVARVERGGRIGYVRLSDGRMIWKEEGLEIR